MMSDGVSYASNPTPFVPPPSMTVPTIDSVCSGMGKGNLLTGVFVDILRKHFSIARNIEFDEMRRAVWSPGENTGIVIAPVAMWKPETSAQRPAVLVRRNKFTKQRVTIGDQRQLQPATAQGFPHYTVVWGGTFTLFCLSAKPLQAEILAVETARELLGFHSQLIESLKLMMLDVTEIDGIGLLEESKQTFVVPVNVFVAYSEAWIVTSQAPPLRKLSLNAVLHSYG